MLKSLLNKLEANQDLMLAIRRHLHQEPELSFQEEKTAAYIADFYRDLGADLETGVGGRGIKVWIDSGRPGKTLALRADFDALPIKEETGLPFASKNPGVMHACGHDGHTAYMMVLAKCLLELRDQLTGRILIIHQDAEEVPPGGAQAMIRDGVLDGVDHIIGAHLMSLMPFGTVQYVSGPAQSGRSNFVLTIKGKGGHGSSPHDANDAIVAGAHFVTAVQTIKSRRLNPFDMGVVTIGSFDGKGQFNIIKDQVTLAGDVRAMSEANLKLMETEIRRLVAGLEVMFGVECDLDYRYDYPVLYNDPDLTEAVVVAGLTRAEAAGQGGQVVAASPQAPSEDFAYYAQVLPASYFYVGASPAQGPAYPHHHPKFDFNESAMLVAAKSMAYLVDQYINS